MATAMKPPMPRGESERKPTHHYYADAYVLKANFEAPVHEEIKPRAQVRLSEDGHYEFRQAEPFRLDGLISYRAGYTQVAGHRSTKPGHGFATLATSVVEKFNVLDVLTADRVVAQISTEHPVYDPDNGQTDAVPSVSFLGTRFDNLRIDGHKIELERHVDILGPKPAENKSYFEDDGVLSRVARQYDNIDRGKNLPEWANVLQQYQWDRTVTQRQGELKCSLVNRATGAPGISFGHVIEVPHFGKIFLAELKLKREKNGRPGPEKYSFHLTMIRMELGCPVQGNGSVVNAESNGGGSQGGGPN
jgi:hypothetical protein